MKVSLNKKEVAAMIQRQYETLYGDEKSISVRMTPYGDSMAEITITEAQPQESEGGNTD